MLDSAGTHSGAVLIAGAAESAGETENWRDACSGNTCYITTCGEHAKEGSQGKQWGASLS